MKQTIFNISIIILVVFSLGFNFINYSDNRQQDKIIMGVVDNITGMIKTDQLLTNQTLTLSNQTSDITKILTVMAEKMGMPKSN